MHGFKVWCLVTDTYITLRAQLKHVLGHTPVLEHWPSKHKAPGLIPSTDKTKHNPNQQRPLLDFALGLLKV